LHELWEGVDVIDEFDEDEFDEEFDNDELAELSLYWQLCGVNLWFL